MGVIAAFIVECDNPACEDNLIVEVDEGEGEDDALRFAHEHGFVTIPVDIEGEEWTIDLCRLCERFRREGKELSDDELRGLCRAERDKLIAAGKWPPPGGTKGSETAPADGPTDGEGSPPFMLLTDPPVVIG